MNYGEKFPPPLATGRLQFYELAKSTPKVSICHMSVKGCLSSRQRLDVILPLKVTLAFAEHTE